MGKKSSMPAVIEPDSPVALCLAKIQISLAKLPPEFASAKAAIDLLAAELQNERIRSGDLSEMALAQTSLHVRTVNMLEAAGITTVGQLLARQQDELRGIRHFGQRTLEEVYSMLAGLGFAADGEAIGMVRGE